MSHGCDDDVRELVEQPIEERAGREDRHPSLVEDDALEVLDVESDDGRGLGIERQRCDVPVLRIVVECIDRRGGRQLSSLPGTLDASRPACAR
jgi:hypothetical protein